MTSAFVYNRCFFFQAEDGIRDKLVTGVQTCALPILAQAFNFFTPPYQIALYVSRSTDGGRTWSERPVQVSGWDNKVGESKGSNGQFPDHESMTVDAAPGSPYHDSAYITWAQFHGNLHAPVQADNARPAAQ